MFNVCLLAVTVALTPLPARDGTPESRGAWETFTHDTLARLFPEYTEAMLAYPLVVTDATDPNAQNVGHIFVISAGLTQLVESQAEYGAVLAHELAHTMLSHESTTLYRDMFTPAGDDMVLLEKQEKEADAFSLLVLRRAGLDPCAAATMFGRVIEYNHFREHPEKPYPALNLRRETVMQKGCVGFTIPPTDKDGFKPALWRVYTELVLIDLWPQGSPFNGVEVSDDEDVFASADPLTGTLRIGWGVIRHVTTADDVAFVVAHEDAHYRKGDQRAYKTVKGVQVPDFKKFARMELNADREAYTLLQQRHRNACAGLSFERRLATFHGAYNEPKDPLNAVGLKRISALAKVCR